MRCARRALGALGGSAVEMRARGRVRRRCFVRRALRGGCLRPCTALAVVPGVASGGCKRRFKYLEGI